MLKTVSAIKVHQNLGQIMNEVSIKADEYIVERAGKPLVAIIPIEKYLNMKGNREDFFRLYSSLQNNAVTSGAVDDDLSEALACTRQ
jgi:prevent-host-death family protein